MTSSVGLHCFEYNQSDVNAEPSLACHIGPFDWRFFSQNKEEARKADAHIGQLMWDKYLRWDYLLSTSLRVLGGCIGERCTRYGVPAFLNHAIPLVAPGDINENELVYRDIMEAEAEDAEAEAEAEAEVNADLNLVATVTGEGERETPCEPEQDTKRKVKLYFLVKRVCAELLREAPIFKALRVEHLEKIVRSVISYIMMHEVTADARPFSPAAAAPGPGTKARKIKKVKEARWVDQHKYWDVGGYGYRCEHLVWALQQSHDIDHNSMRVRHLSLLYTWWRSQTPAPTPFRD